MKKIAGLLVLLAFTLTAALPAAAQQADPGTAQQPILQVTAPDLYQRAQTALDAQEYDRAVRDYSLFILLNPTFSVAYYERAHSHIGLNDLDSALADINHALRISQTNASPEFGAALYLLRGDIEAQQRRFDDALADYTQSLALNQTPETLLNRGLVYAARSDFQSALTDLDNAIGLDSSNPLYYLYRGQLNTAVQNLQGAGADYLDFFNLVSEPQDGAEIKTGQAITLPVEQGVVYRVPFVGKAGQFASARATGESDSIDPLMVLLDPDGNALAGDDDGGGNLTALIFDYELPEDGRYTLLVGHSFGGFTGNVRVQLQISDAPAS